MLMGAALPLAAQSLGPSSPPLPAGAPSPPAAAPQRPATAAVDAAEPKPAPYDVVWSRQIDLGNLRDLALTRSMLVIGGAGMPLEGRSLADGEPVWTWGDAVSDGPLAVGEDAIFAVVDGRVVSVDPATGAIRWRSPEQTASPLLAISGDTVVVASGADVQSLAAASGEQRWRQHLPAAVTLMSAAGATSLVVALSDHSLAMLEAASGDLVWRGELDFAPTGLAATADRVYAPVDGRDEAEVQVDDPAGVDRSDFPSAQQTHDLRGWLCAFKPPAERHDWCWPVRVPAVGPPALGAEYVYVAYLDNTVRAFDRDDGELHSTTGLPARPASGVRTAGRLLAVPLVTGDVAFLDPATRLSVTVARSPDEGLLPLLQAAVVSGDGERVVLLTATASGRTLALFARRDGGTTPPAAPPATTPAPAEAPAGSAAPADTPADRAAPADAPGAPASDAPAATPSVSTPSN